MAKGILRMLRKVRENIKDDMKHGGGLYDKGLSSEGYLGGYNQALSDVELALRGHARPTTRGWWRID